MSHRIIISINHGAFIRRVMSVIICFFLIIDSQGQSLPTTPNNNPGQPSAAGSNKASDNDVFVTVRNIYIIGNKKTKESIILRELGVVRGEVLLRKELDKLLENDKSKIINTRLFLSVDFQIMDVTANQVEILIKVVERWYLFPVPIFKLEARNFNDWWVNQNRALDRVSYGIKFYQYNLRGRNERLRLQAQFGFTKRFDIGYRIPYVDKSQRNGLMLRAGYFENNNIAYKSENHIQQFVDFGKRTRETSFGGLTFSHRPSFYSFHFFSLNYQNSRIKDSVAILNPNFFLDGRTQQKYFRFHYRYRKEVRNVIAYPTEGYMLNFELDKLGLGIYDDINQLELNFDYFKYLDLGKNYFLSSRIGGKVSFPKRQPYLNFRGLGFKPDFIRGYELNVIEGQSFFLHKLSLKKRILNTKFKFHGLIKKEQFNTLPVAIYLKTFFDGGIVNNSIPDDTNNKLVNKYIFGSGVGLDIVTYYDFVVRFEYAINDRGQRGFFINFQSDLR